MTHIHDPAPHAFQPKALTRTSKTRRLVCAITAAITMPLLAVMVGNALWPDEAPRPEIDVRAAVQRAVSTLPGGDAGALGIGDGYVGVGASVSPFSTEPAIEKLRPELRSAVRTAAASWLSEHGSRVGLCQTYANERWHFELAARPGGACPQTRADAASTGGEVRR